MQRAVNAEAKADLRSSIIVQDSELYYPKDHHSLNSTTLKVQTQKITAKNSHPEELKLKKIKSILFSAAEANKPFEQARKEKKKKKHSEK